MIALHNTALRYGAVARLFHGAMFLIIAANLALGFLTDEVETGEGRFAAWHATLGIATLVLLLGRVLWRAIDPPPPLTVGNALEQRIAHAGHLGLYLLIALVAVSGWLVASHECQRIDLLGGATLPSLVAAAPASSAPAAGACTGEAALETVLDDDRRGRGRGDDDHDDDAAEGDESDAAELWEEVHEWASWALLLLVLAHAAAALLHLKRRDGTWERMFG